MIATDTQGLTAEKVKEKVTCPYCLKHTWIVPATNYRPIYVSCALCGERFIAERAQEGIDTFRVVGAPCVSDPECRAIETGQGDEE
jgi:hypothetical protein